MSSAAVGRPPIVPRLALPTPEEERDPAFFRQITLALGTAHRQRSARRDVVFHVRHGRMLEKEHKRHSAALISATARTHHGKDSAVDETKKPWQTARYVSGTTKHSLHSVWGFPPQVILRNVANALSYPALRAGVSHILRAATWRFRHNGIASQGESERLCAR